MNYPKDVQIPINDQLKKIPFMDMVIKESMRIMTTVSAVQRISSSVYTISNGTTIPKNTPLFLHLWGVHHNPSGFSEPYEFNPNRFEDISSEESKNWQPFSLGSRTCKFFTKLLLINTNFTDRHWEYLLFNGTKSYISNVASET
jgi:cytochrome P450